MAVYTKKTINAWAFYDWANSVYPLVITSTIFPIYYSNITSTPTSDEVFILGFTLKNTALYTFALAFAYLLIAILSPILSGIADYSGRKKNFMQFFCYLGAASCAGLFFFTGERLELGLILIILACIGYSGSIVFYNAFLPQIAHPLLQNKVSAKGYAMGYVGSSLLLIFNLMVILKPEYFGNVSAGFASRLSFLLTGLWWFGFAQYSFFHLPGKGVKNGTSHKVIQRGYEEIKYVWKALKNNRKMSAYLLAFFIYNMGVQTIMLIATLFGSKELKMEAGQLIATILIIQFIAIGGAYLFSAISNKKSNIYTLKLATLIWVIVCIIGYFVKTDIQFYFLAMLVGLVMGGTQSLSRSTFSKMLPRTKDHASYFSFYDICDKCGIVIGMAIFGIIEQNFSSMRTPIVALVLFFITGYLLLLRVNNKAAEGKYQLQPILK